MAFEARTGSFVANTVTGSQAVDITGMTETPVVVIFWGVNKTADGFGTGAQQHLGVGISGTKRWAIAAASDDTAGTTNTGRYQTDLRCILIPADGTPTKDAEAEVVSLDANTGSGAGFTLNWADAPSSAWKIHYLALGGSDVQGASVAQFVPAATGAQSVTGIPFQPNFVLAGAINTSSPSGTGWQLNLGMATGASNEGSLLSRDRDAVASSEAVIGQRTDSSMHMISTTAETALGHLMDFTAFTSDGCTFNVTTNQGNQINLLFLKLGNARVMADTVRTTTGTQAKTGAGFQPSAAFAFSWNRAASGSFATSGEAKVSIGAADDATHKGGTWVGLNDAAAADKNQYSSDTEFLVMGSSPSTKNDVVQIQSFDADGYTSNTTTASGTAKEYVVALFGSAASAPADVTITAPPAIAGAGALIGGTSALLQAAPAASSATAIAVDPLTVSAGDVTITAEPAAALASVLFNVIDTTMVADPAAALGVSLGTPEVLLFAPLAVGTASALAGSLLIDETGNYPVTLDALAADKTNSTPTQDDHAVHHNDMAAAINALETKLGIGSSTPVDNSVLVGTATGTSLWSAAPTVTGSRGGNAALASLLTQLAALGIIVDSTSA